jgi:hypothetical protein
MRNLMFNTGNLTFNIVLALAAFIGIFSCLRRQHQAEAATEEMARAHREVLGEIQHVLAKISGDIDRLHYLIPEAQAPEARQVTQELVRAIDEIILITRGEWDS